MKVVHISCVAPPEGGGIGKVADIEVQKLRERGVEAFLITSNYELRITNYELRNIDYIIRLPGFRFGNAARLRGLEEAVRGADIVHLHYPFYGTAGFVAKFRRQEKIKCLVMTLHMDPTTRDWRAPFYGFHRKFFQDKILSSADKLIVASSDYFDSSSFSHSRNSKFDRAQHDEIRNSIHELPFGVETDIFKPGDGNRKKFGIPDGVKVVGTVSVMDKAHPFKGIDVLLKATSKIDGLHLLLVGDGDTREDLEKMAQDLGMEERVHFAGRLSDEDLVTALRTMDVFAFPSTSGAEAFGLAMLEAMACGVPVVASDLPGVRKVADGAGLIVKAGDIEEFKIALQKMLMDDSLRTDLARAARIKAENYSWDKHINGLINIYKQICASRS